MALTPKQEKFCLVFHATSNATEAYRKAYRTKNMAEDTINNQAYKLKQNPHIAARLEDLKKEDRERNKITIESLTSELEEARKLSIGFEQMSAAINAIMGKAKLHGLLVEKLIKTEVPLSEINDKEIDDRIKQSAIKAGIALTLGGESQEEEGK